MLKTPTPRGGGVWPWGAPTLFPLPVDEKAIMNNTPDKRACDGHFPLPVKGKAIPSYEAPRSPAEPFRALRSSVRTPATEPCRVPGKSFSSTGKGKSESQAPHDCLFLVRQREKRFASARRVPMIVVSSTGKGTKEIASTRHVPMIAFSSTGRGETESQAQAMFPRPPFPRQW